MQQAGVAVLAVPQPGLVWASRALLVAAWPRVRGWHRWEWLSWPCPGGLVPGWLCLARLWWLLGVG